MKPIQKILIIPILINLGIWTYNYWEQLSLSLFFTGAFSMLVAYAILYFALRGCMDSYAEKLLKHTVNYLHKNHRLETIEFTPIFYEDISIKFASYVLIGLLLFDSLALYKFKFSLLSVVNLFIAGGAEQ